MRHAYYPGITSPSKLGLKLAGFAPPCDEGHAQRRKIVTVCPGPAPGGGRVTVGPGPAPGGGRVGEGAAIPLAQDNPDIQAWTHATPRSTQGPTHATPRSTQGQSFATPPHRDKAREQGRSQGAGAQSNGSKQRKTPAANGSSAPAPGQARTLVAVRARPPIESERQQQQFEACITVNHAHKAVEISRSFLNKKQYAFDAVFDESADTAQVYESLVHPLVLHVLDGYSAVVTAFGQSATGKTHTLGTDASSINSGCLIRACTALLYGLDPGGGGGGRRPPPP